MYAGACAAGKGYGVSSGAPGIRVALPHASTRAWSSSAGCSPRATLSASAWSPVACSSIVCASTQNGHRLASDTPSAASSFPVLPPSPAISDSRISAHAEAMIPGAEDSTTKVGARVMPKSLASWV